MKTLAALVPLLGVANGIWALALNYRRWKHPEQDTTKKARLRHVVTYVFLGLLALLVLLLIGIAVVSLASISD